MLLREIIAPALNIAGPAALALVIMRYFPHVLRAVLVLVAGIVAIKTTNEERREASLKVLDSLGRQGETPPDETHQAQRKGLSHPWRRADSGSGLSG